jgi:AcrR family transcriptional regulator
LSRGSIYRYFPDRDALVLAALARADERYLRTAHPAVSIQPTLTAQVAEAVGFVRRHRGDETALGLTGRPDEPELATLRLASAADVLERWIGFWTPFIAAAQARGEVRADLDPHAAGEWIMRIVISLVTVPSRSVDLDDPAAVRQHLHEHLVRGMAPAGGTPATGGTPPTDPGTAGRSTAWA